MDKKETCRLDQGSATQQIMPVEIAPNLQMEAVFFFFFFAFTHRSTIKRCSSEKWSSYLTDVDISVSQLTFSSTYKFYCVFCTLQAFYRK
jgi:hypothetical protein